MTQDVIFQGKTKDLGGFAVSRSLPTLKKRSVGPFVFIDHMGPMILDETHFLDVRPHPHIGLGTVTFLYEGRGFHRDSLGSKQIINPGEINLMVAGKGIVHSERTPEEDKKNFHGKSIHGLQIWFALPVEKEECEPEFINYPFSVIPQFEISPSIKAHILMGKLNGKKSPVKTFSQTLFVSLECGESSSQEFGFTEEEIAFLVVEGEVEINSQRLQKNDLIVIQDPQKVSLKCESKSIVAIFGGAKLPEPRFMWWNFVSSRKKRIHQAASDWKNQMMGKVEGEVDFIPLPNIPLP